MADGYHEDRERSAGIDVADWVDEHGPEALVEETRDYARRHPGMFLGMATLTGLVVGRLTRGTIANQRSADGHGSANGHGSADGHRQDRPADPTTSPYPTSPAPQGPSSTYPPRVPLEEPLR